MNTLGFNRGFQTADEIRAASFRSGGQRLLVCRCVDDAETTGYNLYSATEWNASVAADYTADTDGRIMFAGRFTGRLIPCRVMRAAL